MSDNDPRYTTMLSPEGLAGFHQRAHLMRAGTWGNGKDRFCMMSAAVPGARSVEDCVTAGWPYWFVDLSVAAFDGKYIELDRYSVREERNQWAVRLITATAEPVDYHLAYRRCVSEFLDIIAANPGPAHSRLFTSIMFRKDMLLRSLLNPVAAITFNPLVRHGIREGLIHRSHGADYANYVAERIGGHPALPIYLYDTAVFYRTRRDQPQVIRDLRHAMLDAVLSARAPAPARQSGLMTTRLAPERLNALSGEQEPAADGGRRHPAGAALTTVN